MAKITVDGTIQLTKSGSTSVATLWETKLNQRTQQDQKTAYKLWQTIPAEWVDGTWVEVTGELSVRPSMNADGTPRTYTNKDGHIITAHDLNINDVVIHKVKVPGAVPPTGAVANDPHDDSKYGTPFMQVMDDNPF
jgi:hypothetical protein